MRDKRKEKAWVIAWVHNGKTDQGDVTFTYEEAEMHCHGLNQEYLHMFHYPLHVEEIEADASENN
jgi:hypothetical protein